MKLLKIVALIGICALGTQTYAKQFKANAEAEAQDALLTLDSPDCLENIEWAAATISYVPWVNEIAQNNLIQYQKALLDAQNHLRYNQSNAHAYGYFQKELKNQEDSFYGAPFAKCARQNLNFSANLSKAEQFAMVNRALAKVKSVRKAMQ